MNKSNPILGKGTQLRFLLNQDKGQKEQVDDIVTIKNITIDLKTNEIYLDFEEGVDLLYTYDERLFEIYKQPWE